MRAPGSIAVCGVLLLIGCGENTNRADPEQVVKQWGDAINGRQWERACRLTVAADAACERRLQNDFGDAQLEFRGPAIDGGGTKPGEHYFSFGGSRGTIFVSAVPRDERFAVRVELIVLP